MEAVIGAPDEHSGPKDGGAARRHGVRFAKFGAVGAINTAVDFTIFAGLIALGPAPWLANIVSFMIANLGSYFLNARITFRNAEGPARVSPAGYATFFAAHAASLIISTGIVALLAGRIGALAAKLIAIAVTVFWNYAASALLVYKRRDKS